MLRPTLTAVVFFCLSAMVSAQTFHVRGVVRPGLAPFDITVKAAYNDVSGFSTISSLEVTKKGRCVQTIRFRDDDSPAVQKLSEAVTLRDLDCDGYKDLLVQRFNNNHGERWFHLYRFSPSQGKFVLYRPFSQLPFESVNCHTKTVSTYVNEGGAGCIYSSTKYQWSNGRLLPARVEAQGPIGDGGEWFIRSIEIWKGGKRMSSPKKKVPADDCHR